MAVLRSLCRSASAWLRSSAPPSPTVKATSSSPASSAPMPAASRGAPPPNHLGADCRSYLSAVVRVPAIKDPEILDAVEDLLANDWDQLPFDVVYGAKEALSSNTTDEAGKQVLANVLRAAESVEEITRMMVPLKTELDAIVRWSGKVIYRDLNFFGTDIYTRRRSKELGKALQPLQDRYATLLDSFGPEESYLRHKVETESRNNFKRRSIVVLPVVAELLDYLSYLLD